MTADSKLSHTVLPTAIRLFTKETIKTLAGIEPTAFGVLSNSIYSLPQEISLFVHSCLSDHSNNLKQVEMIMGAEGFPNWLLDTH